MSTSIAPIHEAPSWLLVLRPDGIVESVDGGAPKDWTDRNIMDIPELHSACAAFQSMRMSPPGLVRRSIVSFEGREGPVTLELLLVEALPIRRAYTRVSELVMRTLDAFVSQAHSSDVDLNVEQSDDIPPVLLLDGEKISWAIATLVGNALRYTQSEKNGRRGHVNVELGWNDTKQEMTISVRDNGPGIPEHRVRWLFERNPASGQAAGLALLMVRDVVVAHGGTAEVTSVLGQGTTFTLTLPKSRP